jgi:hypothetical protein
MSVLGFAIAFLLLNVIPSLLLGHLAERWNRDRVGWTVASVLLGWLLVLPALLIVGPFALPRRRA